jgi:hypothetical protein
MAIEADLKALGFEVEGDPEEIEAELDKFAEQIADEIRDLTPEFNEERDRRKTPGIGSPGDAKAAIHVKPMGRGSRRVVSNDAKAGWIEYGTRHMPEYAPFGKVAAMHGGTGPMHDEGVNNAQEHLRGELEKLEKLRAEEAGPHSIAQQKQAVDRARSSRSAAFKAARSSRGGGRRGRSR